MDLITFPEKKIVSIEDVVEDQKELSKMKGEVEEIQANKVKELPIPEMKYPDWNLKLGL